MSQQEIQEIAVMMGRCRGHFTHCKFLDITPRSMVEETYEWLYKIARYDYPVEDFR